MYYVYEWYYQKNPWVYLKNALPEVFVDAAALPVSLPVSAIPTDGNEQIIVLQMFLAEDLKPRIK